MTILNSVIELSMPSLTVLAFTAGNQKNPSNVEGEAIKTNNFSTGLVAEALTKDTLSLKIMMRYTSLLILFLAFLFSPAKAQPAVDSVQLKKEFFSLDEALKNPEKVYRLDLSNQDLQSTDTIWSKFTNLEYLSLKNDHLKQLPTGIGYLKNLKVLDLSGNDFKVLPSTFVNLTNLQELLLNDDKYFKLEKSIPILSTLPNLTSLHIENDGLKSLPEDISKISHLESLYLNNNKFKQLPVELKGLKSLQYLDFHDNKVKLPKQGIHNQDFGFKIRF